MTDAFRTWIPKPYEDSPESKLTYPRPRPEVKLYPTGEKGPYPTNSWLENVITDRYPVAAQLPYFNCTPWYWAVDYAKSSFVVDHSLTAPFTNTLTEGQILQIQPEYSIRVESPNNTNKNLALTYHDDFCATFTSDNFDAYPCRGALSCDFVLKKGALDVIFTPYIVNVNRVVIDGNVTTIPTTRATTTTNNTDLKKATSRKVMEGFYYDGLAAAPGIVRGNATINALPAQRGETSSISNIAVVFSTASFAFDPVVITPGVAVSGTLTRGSVESIYNYATPPSPASNLIVLSVRDGSDKVWDFVFDWNDPNVYKMNCNFTTTKSQEWVVHYENVGVGVSSTDNKVFFTPVAGGTARVQLQLGGTALLPKKTAIIVKGSVENFTSTTGVGGAVSASCQLVLETLPGDTADKVLYMPEHWLRMLGRFSATVLASIPNFIYGNLYPLALAETNGIQLDNDVLPGISGLSVFVETSPNLLPETLLKTANEDAARYILQIPQSGPYQFGTIVGKMSRIYSLFDAYGGTLAAQNGVTKSIFKSPSEAPQINTPGTGLLTEQWLAGTNINAVTDWTTIPLGFMSPKAVFQLLRDDIWSGVITPADYLQETFVGTPIGLRYASNNFGNAYYNDHHFHWGYFFYILTVFAKLGINYYTGVGVSGIPSKSYAPQILALLKDVVNPVSDAFGWKVRHKDWYAGHSWATGVGDSIQRQNESMGESCNCYYSAYHLCSTLAADPNVSDRVELLAIRDCAFNALVMEILALQSYYLNGTGKTATNAFQGSLAKTAGVGIILNNSKQCTTDWAPQPESHNGRMLGVYGIHFLPFNQLVKTTITREWVETAARGTSVPGSAPYATPSSLVNTLCQFREYIPVLAPNETAPKFVKEDGVRWGAIGLKYLSFHSPADEPQTKLLTPNDAYTSYNSVHVAQEAVPEFTELFHQTDSLTNTLYWLSYNSFLKGATSNQLFSADVPGLSVNVDLPCGPRSTLSLEQLLADSPARCESKIGVPLVYLQICLDDANSRVGQSFFQIYDEFCYNNARACIHPNQQCCYLNAVDPAQLKLTRLQTDLNPALVVQGPGNTLYDKLIGSSFDPNTVAFYAILKLIFARILTGKFDLKYLTQRYIPLYRQLLKTRFCAAYSENILLSPDFAGMDALFLP